MLLNFQRVFADDVRTGRKRQTIRSAGQRKDVPAVGGMAHCFTGLRTRSTQKLGSWPISQVDVIRMGIGETHITDVIVGAGPLSRLELTALAGKDGFVGWPEMERWFVQAHGPQEFYGWVIRWDWAPAEAPERGTVNLQRPAACVGCGCTDGQGCPEGCWWLEVDRSKGQGVCSCCSDRLEAWRATQHG